MASSLGGVARGLVREWSKVLRDKIRGTTFEDVKDMKGNVEDIVEAYKDGRLQLPKPEPPASSGGSRSPITEDVELVSGLASPPPNEVPIDEHTARLLREISEWEKDMTSSSFSEKVKEAMKVRKWRVIIILGVIIVIGAGGAYLWYRMRSNGRGHVQDAPQDDPPEDDLEASSPPPAAGGDHSATPPLSKSSSPKSSHLLPPPPPQQPTRK